jgi:hypothetical protein
MQLVEKKAQRLDLWVNDRAQHFSTAQLLFPVIRPASRIESSLSTAGSMLHSRSASWLISKAE